MDRRTSLALILLAGGSIVGLNSSASRPAIGSAAASGRGGVFLQVCAHPDDDLYFFNPDVWQAIRAGCPVTTVYLTAGEADGINARQGTRDKVKIDFEGYAAARQHGIRSAYAAMATGDRDAQWARRLRPALGGLEIEVATLTAARHICLVFLNLRIPSGLTGAAANRLFWLWTGERERQDYLRPTGSPLPGAGTMSREDVLGILVSLMIDAKPTVVRTLDPAPEHLTYTSDGTVSYSDHQDHRFSAYFALEAVRRYQRASGRHVQVQSYRGYFNRYWPRNLSKAAYRKKLSYLDLYGWADGHPCDEPAGCGDLQVGGGARAKEYGRSLTYRYPGTTSWLQPLPDGRLAAFAVLGGQVLMWTQRNPGDHAWNPPAVIGDDAVPHLSVIRAPDGRLHVFGVRHRFPASPAQRQVVFHTSQTGLNGRFGPCMSLGSPASASDPVQCSELGMPVAVVESDGRLSVFVRNFDSGVSMRTQHAHAAWGPWTSLGGVGIRDSLAAVSDSNGGIDLYTVTAGAMLHWRRTTSEAAFTSPTSILTAAMDGTLSTVRTADAGYAGLIVGHANGTTATLIAKDATTTLSGSSGLGPVASLRHRGKLRLIRRNDSGGVDISNSHFMGDQPRWAPSGGLFTGAPAIAVDAKGRQIAATIGVDGNLWVCELTEDDSAPKWVPAYRPAAPDWGVTTSVSSPA